MARKHKKRTKRYTGEDAKITGVARQSKPAVYRYEAKQRSPLGQWLQDHRQAVRYSLIASGVVGFIALIVSGIVQLFTL